ncbi:MMPL family transporter [Paenarthrobacter aurescens]|uniref:Membrane protein n=1 Tax=Paenarthrobacter aurescens TaxID=43663 RepID=A0A4Y3NK65_PAEAU|nr:MMPL family transporter [Paenarthrobacter aurescens]MDO6142933.1 MMPL family transporter [Paenarthrobacter aurescens]MDO6146778.1 MMPL family transporter [Paenarthrobacter aurescens]MDO6158024.1 MMPL family transporter [Paenarthrobacter aurescens]MDO6162009.1 MMPL family transporter [Paenarthrobacter aurescens]GEB19478.1 membrane protein [Paenarthrobacter aurescens]
MASFLYRLGKFSYRRRWLVISIWLAVMVAVGGSAAAFHGTMSNNFTIPGTETQQMADKLKEALPESSGGSASVVFDAGDAGFDQARKDAVAAALTKLEAMPDVQGTVNPFTTQEQVEKAAADIAAGEAKAAEGKAQLEASRAQLEAGETQLAGLEQQLAASGLTPAQIEAQLAPQRAELAAGKARLDAGAKEAADGAAALALGKRQVESSDGLRFVSSDNKVAIAQVQFKTSINAVDPAVREEVQEIVQGVSSAGVTAYASKEITEDVSEIFGIAEIVGVAVAALVLILMLGTLIAAGLPLVMALIGVAVGVGGTFALTSVIDMSSISPMLALMLGLAVGIDYSLFIVNRHRTQLLAGMDAEESAALATGTSGNAVLFAGLTVIIALAALVVPGLPFLAVMGVAAAATVAVAVVVALTLTPAVLALIGRRLISKRAWAKAAKHNAEPGHEAADREREEKRSSGGWGGMVTRHPWVALVASVVLLGALALPASQLRLALPDGGSEPVDSQAFQAYDLTRTSFGEGMTGPIIVVGEFPEGLSENDAKNKQFDVADQLRSVENVIAAVPVALSEDRRTAVFQVIPKEGPASAGTVQVVSDLRAKGSGISQDLDVQIGLTGQTAGNIDVSNKLGAALPPYLAIVVGLSLLLLLLVFRSIVVPLLATGGFLLSLAAAFGAVVAVYQWGWLGGIFDVANPGAVLSFLPIILIGVLFGLAMDYQVFITSGMRESFMHGESAKHAVRSGFSHAAAVVTAAAIIMVSVFSGFIFSHLTMVRPLGFAMAFGVLIDAFVVRMTIVPAVMYLLGEKAWWLPKWLERILPDVDVEGAKLERSDRSKAGSEELVH